MIRVGLRILALLWLVPLTVASALTPEQKERLIDKVGRRLDRHAYVHGVDLSQWPEYVAAHKQPIQSAGTAEELRKALQAALDEFQTSHLAILTPEDKKRSRAGQRTGVGVAFQPEEQGYFITHVIKDSPAWKADLRKGDIITSLDGEPVTAPEQFRAEVGSTRSVSWIRDGEAMSSMIEYTIFSTAEESEMRWIDGDVALIRIDSFQSGYYRHRKVARFFKQARDARAIIIDLRSNRGGLLMNARHLASQITPRNAVFARSIGQRQARRGEPSDASLSELAAQGKRHRPWLSRRSYDGIVFILVDHASASAADLFPASMQEQGRAVVIGQKTSGNLLLARAFRLPYGFQLYAPIAEIVTPGGRRLESIGLEPDIPLDHRATAIDAQILKVALEAIEETEAQPSPSE